MGFKKDQNYFPETYRAPATAPPLPPRTADPLYTPSLEELPSYVEEAPTYHSRPLTYSWSAQDLRSRSSESLVPERSLPKGKRTLLLVYIHGFMGNETSFQSFPAHVHNVLAELLDHTHDVHTKIYPRYKTRKAIECARDDFSTWLRPHESTTTDVILVGHSMGGILSAEVALVGLHQDQGSEINRHRILGTINLDTPFLGMHPGVVASGLSSLFTPARDIDGTAKDKEDLHQMLEPQSTADGSSSTTRTHPQNGFTNGSATLHTTHSGSSNGQPLSPALTNYNTPFPNDVYIATRSPWANALHFVNKHSDSLVKATRSYVASYFEFGGCMADYNGLKMRYSRLRELEDVARNRADGRPRIRFVNYYTASTGRAKRQKPRTRSRSTSPVKSDAHGCTPRSREERLGKDPIPGSGHIDRPGSCSGTSPRNSVERHTNGQIESEISNDYGMSQYARSDSSGSQERSRSKVRAGANGPVPRPKKEFEDNRDYHEDVGQVQTVGMTEAQAEGEGELEATLTEALTKTEPHQHVEADSSASLSLTSTPSLPPIPSQPEEPAAFDPSLYPEKDARKLAEKEYSRQVKVYQRAIKDRDQAIKDRRKFLEKREKNSKLIREKEQRREKKEIAKAKKGAEKRASEETKDSSSKLECEDAFEAEVLQIQKPKRDKKFCMLPPKINGEIDPCWVRVFMRDVDEVGAHCGLFFIGEHYEWLVTDVGKRIKEWVEQQ